MTETTTSYRQLSAEEIILLGQKWENYQRWERVREYVTTLYPPEAHEITISVTSEYNDNTYDDNAHILVADHAGELLSFDFSLPWWRQFGLSEGEETYMREDKSAAVNNVTGAAEEAIKTLVTDLLGVEFLETWQPRDPITYTYIVDAPPRISFAEVLVAERGSHP
jgi:hypothetical protein